MDKKKFNRLTILEQINYINELLKQNKTLRQICEDIGVGRTTIRDRFEKAGYKFNIELKQYIPIEDENKYKDNISAVEHKDNTNIIKYKSNISAKEYKNNAIILDNQEMKRKLFELINTYDSVKEMLEWYEKQKNIIETSELKINTSKLTGDIKTTTIRLYSDVWAKFKEFCDKYPEYKSMDLISMALIEFMDKYKK